MNEKTIKTAGRVGNVKNLGETREREREMGEKRERRKQTNLIFEGLNLASLNDY